MQATMGNPLIAARAPANRDVVHVRPKKSMNEADDLQDDAERGQLRGAAAI
jgi:hypothetical protein